ncbi:HEAT repeat domain-containing protein [Gordonia sputi]|uniref:HEAT repeat domain-containing protein n=1 Tax=Gordonia sputi TaxID=36823 RepID=UPI003983E164
MVALLHTQPAEVRRPVTHYLGRFRTDRSHNLLVHLLSNDPEVTQDAMTALARMKRPGEDIPRLRPYLDDPRELIRRDASRAITKLERARSG